VHGEYWNAEADGEVTPGERVEVVGVDGMTLKVKRVSSNPAG
jgi:membrane protein implicated in regulation of membrane protease activity